MAGCESRKTVDSHVHLRDIESIPNLVEIARAASFDRVNIVCVSGRGANESAFVAKARHPGLFHVFGGLDHLACASGGRVEAPSLAEQVDRLMAIGCDGIKLLETKPNFRKAFDVPIDGEYFEPFFARAEETDVPVIWHVNDPEEFWDEDKCPRWAKEHGWLYDETFATKEQLYSEVDRVLERHPRLRVVFAHFYFLSADLVRAERFLERHPSVGFDVTPGIELLYNMSRNVDRAREFFVKFAGRIFYGTDIYSSQNVRGAVEWADMVRRWLATGDTFRESEESGALHGLALPSDCLQKMLHANFGRLAGASPKPLDGDLARAECERIACEWERLAMVEGLPAPLAERAGPATEHAKRAAGMLA